MLPRAPDSFRTARVAEHTFLAAPITPGCTIVDLGVNLGGFSTSMIRKFGCSVVGVEPVPELFEAITGTHGLTVEHLAISAEVKVDIEGAEIEMFETTPVETLQRIDQFSIEFHGFLDSRQADDIQRVKQRLRSAGFSEMAFSTDNTDVLFVNQARVPFASAQKAAAAVLYKYPRGISRNLQRRCDDSQRARRAT
jgi:hypothetical protein